MKAWYVYRQDDNGNRELLKICNSEDEADKLVERFEGFGHKQTYFWECK